MGVVADIRELAGEEFQLVTVVASLGVVGEGGAFVAGSTVDMTSCRIELGNTRIVDSKGTEIYSKGVVISLGDNQLFSGANAAGEEYRFTLPSSWPEPRTLLRAVDVKRDEDEDGEAYEEVWL